MNHTTETALRTGIFNDPLADWPNDDLLLSQASRDRLRQTHPALLRVLDWPELRDAFSRHDGPAARGKRASHRQGLLAIAFSGLGVVLLGVTPTFPDATADRLSTAALLFMTLGGALGVMHWVFLRSRAVWLGHRFWTERLRQLYFQSLVNTADLSAAALTGDTALATLKTQRAIWLADFYTDPADPRDRVRAVVQDRTEANTWLRPEWKQSRPLAANPDAAAPILAALYRQRIGIQSFYAEKNLGSDVFSPTTRARLLHAISDGSTILVIAAAALGWLAHLIGPTLLGASALVWTSVAAVLSAASLVARATDQGLQNEADADRYAWYADAVREIKARYEAASPDQQLLELRRLEELSYQELRRFLRTHNSARFLM